MINHGYDIYDIMSQMWATKTIKEVTIDHLYFIFELDEWSEFPNLGRKTKAFRFLPFICYNVICGS